MPVRKKKLVPPGTTVAEVSFPKYRSLKYASEVLDVSMASVYRMVAAKKLKTFKIGGSIRTTDTAIAAAVEVR